MQKNITLSMQKYFNIILIIFNSLVLLNQHSLSTKQLSCDHYEFGCIIFVR